MLKVEAQPLFPVIEVKSYVVVVFGLTLIGFPLASFPEASRVRLVGTEPNVPTTLKLGVPVKLKSKVVLCPWQIIGFAVLTDNVGYSFTVTTSAGFVIDPGHPVISERLRIEYVVLTLGVNSNGNPVEEISPLASS